MREHGLGFLTSTTWDVDRQQFGVLPQIWGTLYSSLLALLIGGFFGVAMAIFLTQDFLPPRLAQVFRTIVELLAAIPSVVYGLWGLFVVVPAMRPVANWLYEHLGLDPVLRHHARAAPAWRPPALVLAIMVLPTVAAVSQDALRLVPYKVKEAAYGMGTTRWEAILRVMLPAASTGIFGALVLGFGRALGETMALAMLIGNSNQISLSLFSPANTLAALLALNFPEAGPQRGPGADVRGAGPARHHARRQHRSARRIMAHASREERRTMSDAGRRSAPPPRVADRPPASARRSSGEPSRACC